MGSCCNASGCDYYIVLTLLFYSFLLTDSKKKCNEEFVNNCYQQYNHNATPICPEVKKLRMCISELTGCHAMKHPKFVQSRDILERHRDCFFVNYSRILEVLKNKGVCCGLNTLCFWQEKCSKGFILWPFKRVLNKRCTYFEGVLVVLCVQLYFLCSSISYQIHGNEKNATFFSTLTKWYKWWSSQIHTLATCNRSVCQKYVPCTSPRICPNWTFFSRPVSFAQ